MKTKIQWCTPPNSDGRPRVGYTWNPIRGCQKVSRGCQHCYAEATAKRQPDVLGHWGDKPRVLAEAAYMVLPGLWHRQAVANRERRIVFCGSMFDIGEDRPESGWHRREAVLTAETYRGLDWVLTTKRPAGLADLLQVVVGDLIPAHIWPMVTGEGNAELAARTPDILRLADMAGTIALSLEPLLDDPSEALDELLGQLYGWEEWRCPTVWVIWGGESGPWARPCNLQWIRNGLGIVQKWRSKGLQVRPFVKQLGNAGWDEIHGIAGPAYRSPACPVNVRRWKAEGGDIHQWPAEFQIREWPGQYPAWSAS